MRIVRNIAAALLLMAQPALAVEPSELHRLTTGDDNRGWEAVGRINIGTSGFCTGALIAPDLVLTAAHCMFDARSGQMVDFRQMEFLADWRNGRALAYRNVRRAVVHPAYEFVGPEGALRVVNDLALLELDRPIRNGKITPFAIGDAPRKGAQVAVVTYAWDREDSPSMQDVCHVLARQSGSLVLSCNVDYGSSGAPIFSVTDGVAQIVSVVSAKAEVRGRPVSLGTSLVEPLAEMKALLDAGAGTGPRPVAESVSQRGGAEGEPVLRVGGSSSGGAKFMRP